MSNARLPLMVRGLLAGVTMVAAVPQNMTWKTKKAVCQESRLDTIR